MYKTIRMYLLMATGLLVSSSVFAQATLTFEEFEIGLDTFWDGSDLSGGFMSETVFFPNTFSQGFWLGGWALSSKTDSITSGFMNLFSAKTAAGYEGSQNYVLGQQGSVLTLNGASQGTTVDGFYITNTTYAHNSMRDGDDFAKMFGGETGNDPDFFKVSIKKWRHGELSTDSIDFYLGDYRFEDNTMDYIVDTWEWVDLSPLGDVDSLLFTLYSSDVSGAFLNTPAFFAVDNFSLSGISDVKKVRIESLDLTTYPNPTTDAVQLDWSAWSQEKATISLFDVNGQQLKQWNNIETATTLNLERFAKGMYFLRMEFETYYAVKRLVVN